MLGKSLKSANQYQVMEEIGQGRNSTNYLIEKKGLGTRYLLKRIELEKATQPAFKKRMVAEHKIMAGHWHAGIPRLHDRFKDDRYIYHVYDFVEGRCLMDLLEQPLSSSRATNFIERLLSIVSGLHQHYWIHRDLNPRHILIRGDGQLTLLNVSKAQPISDGPSNYEPAITAYTPPEFIRGARADQRSDIYAAGALLFHCLTGRAPFEDTHERTMKQAISQGPPPRLQGELSRVDRDHFQNIINMSMATALEKRYKNCDQFLKALQTRDTSLDDSLWGTPSRSFEDAASLGLPDTPLQSFVTEDEATVMLERDPDETIADLARTEMLEPDTIEYKPQKPKPKQTMRNLWEQ